MSLLETTVRCLQGTRRSLLSPSGPALGPVCGMWSAGDIGLFI